MTLLLLIGIGAALVMGLLVLRANPTRGINRVFFVLSALVVAWLITLSQINPAKPNILFWIRLANAEAAVLPWLFWVLKETVHGERFGSLVLRRSWPWAAIAIGLVVLCFSNQFIPAESTPERMLNGPGRPIFNVVIAVEYLWLLAQAVKEMRAAKGIRRVEFQFLMINGAAAGFCAIVLNTVSVTLRLPELRRAEPLLIVSFYGIAAWAVTSRKVFDAKQLLRYIFVRIQMLAAVGAVVAVMFYLGEHYVSRTVAVVGAAVVLVVMIEGFGRRNLMVVGLDQNSEATRRRLGAVGRALNSWTHLEENYTQILSEWGHSEHVYIFCDADGGATAKALPAPFCVLAEKELEKVGWMTPERLEREVPVEARTELSEYMREHNLGAIIVGPRGPGVLPIILAQGARYDRRPFTYLDIQFLKDCLAMIEGGLSRVLLTQQARDSEQLATAGLLGTSLAHELRNPLVTIKSVVHEAKIRYGEPGFQRLLCDVVPAEISRMEVLLTGLMDLGKPREPVLETFHLNELVAGAILFVTPRAKERGVTITQRLAAQPDSISADKMGLRQVILNLVMNAIDALGSVPDAREVTVATMRAPDFVILEIGDNGPGVPPAARQTLFRPFTKSSKTSGMGLGLAICADIVNSHSGEIKLVERPGSGALFRITLPCQQP